MKTNRILSLSVLGLVWTAFMPIAFRRDYYAIVDNFGKEPRMAFMDVSLEALPGSVFDFLLDVYDAQGIPLAEFTVRANAYGFASSSSWGRSI